MGDKGRTETRETRGRGNPGTGRCERFQPAIIHPAEYFYGFTFSGRIANLIPLGFTVHGRSRGFLMLERSRSAVSFPRRQRQSG